jgi:broad specificity phosphatase PhoE
MRRTIQTAQICLASVLEKGVPLVLRGEWQEVTAKPCDQPVPVLSTKALFPDIPEAAYASLVAPFPEKSGTYAFTPQAVVARGELCLAWLKARPEKVIAVVSHSGFLRVGIANRGFANGDYRVFDFVDGDEKKARRAQEMDDRPGLVESDMTRPKGGLKTSWEGKQGVESQV